MVRVTPLTGCWRWPGYHRPSDGRPIAARRYVYRLIYEAATGAPAPEGLHHLCGNAWCVNPTHLAPLSQSDHARAHGRGGDWGQAAKAHCPAGHPYSDENTYTYTRSDGRVERHCRLCRREAKRRYVSKSRSKR